MPAPIWTGAIPSRRITPITRRSMTSCTIRSAGSPAISISRTMPGSRSTRASASWRPTISRRRARSFASRRHRPTVSVSSRAHSSSGRATWIHQDYQVAGLADNLSVNGHPGTLWLTQQHRVDKDYAVFGEASYDILPKLTATVGGRAFIYDNTLEGFFGFGRDPNGPPYTRGGQFADGGRRMLHDHGGAAARQSDGHAAARDRRGWAVYEPGAVFGRRTDAARGERAGGDLPVQPDLEAGGRRAAVRHRVTRVPTGRDQPAGRMSHPMRRTS